MAWTKRVQIPERKEWEVRDNECPYRCPFLDGSEPGTLCTLGFGIVNDKGWDVYPGPDCPGPGWYVITKEDA